MASTMRARSSGPATCATKVSLGITHTRTCGSEAEGREGRAGGNWEEEGKSGGRTHLELLVEEDARLLVRAFDDAQRRTAGCRRERKLMGCGNERKLASR
jgi:hypothetical protein